MSAPSAPDAAPRAMPAPARVLLVAGLLYLFLLGVGLLEDGIGALGEDVQRGLFDGISHPLAGLFVGVLATVLTQSSSVTTATVVGLVGGGLIGVEQAVPVVLGANVGTTVTSTVASLGSVRRPQEFRNAFAAASVHDVYNLLSVAVVLPLELTTRFLSRSATALADAFVGGGGATFESPLRRAVRAPVEVVIGLWEHVASGTALGLALIVTALACVFTALAFITRNMRTLVADRVERSLNTLLARGGGTAALLLGLVITLAVQSSTITTSILVPMAAAGIISVRNVYPVTVGANVGTTFTAVLAAMAASRPEALAIALVHTLHNLVSVGVFFVLPGVRELPVRIAERMGDLAVRRRSIVLAYVVGTFIVVPAVGLVLLR